MTAVSPFILDNEKDDPREVDDILSKELLALSFEERNGIQSEIHGIGCLAPKETPQLLENSLRKLDAALENDNVIPYNLKFWYRQARNSPGTYVDESDFRLRFLRATLFDPIKAAEKMCRFLTVAQSIFGDVALKRAIRLSDFKRKDKQYIRKGHIQFLPFTDRSGRRILILMNPTMYTGSSNRPFMHMTQEERSENIIYQQVKLLMYIVWAAGDDVETQRRGLVYIFWSDPEMEQNQEFSIGKLSYPRIRIPDMLVVRPSAIHICSPDTPLHRFFRKLSMIQAGKVVRNRIKFHLGESIELRYALRPYGIPTEHIPISISGTIKVGMAKQWMRVRAMMESNDDEKSKSETKQVDASTIVECPNLQDVLFRQGTSSTSHPGNAMVRRLIIEAYQNESTIKVRRRKLVLFIIHETERSGGRFLVWNEEGWWEELVEEETLIAKIEYIIKGTRRERDIARNIAINSDGVVGKKNYSRLDLDSSTFIFHSEEGGSAKRRKHDNDQVCFSLCR